MERRVNAFTAAALTCVGLLLGCRSGGAPPEPGASESSSTRPTEAPPASPSAEAPSTSAVSRPVEPLAVINAEERVVAIGDLHGDFEATVAALRMAGLIDADAHWSGGKAVLVQTGDQLDRGGGEEEILKLLAQLEVEAPKAGGRLVVLNGNHETMNVLGDFRYVTEDALDDFTGAEPASPFALAITGQYRDRARAFLPGGQMAVALANRPVVAQVNDTVFVHAGVRDAHVRGGLESLNREVQAFFRGETAQPPARMVDPDGPLWTRIYGGPELSSAVCAELVTTLSALGAKRLVIGHTVQSTGITSACEERVFRIDVGLSRAYGDNAPEALEIHGGVVKVLRASAP